MSYKIHIPISGGKAGKGLNKTSSLQVRMDGCILKQFRFKTSDREDRQRAFNMANMWIEYHRAKTRLEIAKQQ